MKSAIEVDPSQRLVTLRLEGIGTFEECRGLIGDLGARADIGTGFGVLADIRARQYPASLSESRQLADERSRMPRPAGPLAIVVGDDLHHGTSRQFAALSEVRGRQVAVFRDIGEARAWLSMRDAAEREESA